MALLKSLGSYVGESPGRHECYTVPRRFPRPSLPHSRPAAHRRRADDPGRVPAQDAAGNPRPCPASRPPRTCTGTCTPETWTSTLTASVTPPPTPRVRPKQGQMTKKTTRTNHDRAVYLGKAWPSEVLLGGTRTPNLLIRSSMCEHP